MFGLSLHREKKTSLRQYWPALNAILLTFTLYCILIKFTLMIVYFLLVMPAGMCVLSTFETLAISNAAIKFSFLNMLIIDRGILWKCFWYFPFYEESRSNYFLCISENLSYTLNEHILIPNQHQNDATHQTDHKLSVPKKSLTRNTC